MSDFPENDAMNATGSDAMPALLPEAPPPPARRGMGGGTALSLSLLVSAGLAAGLAFLFLFPRDSARVRAQGSEILALNEALTSLRADQAGLSQRLDHLGAANAAATNAGGEDAAKEMEKVKEELASLSARLDHLAAPGTEAAASVPASTANDAAAAKLAQAAEANQAALASLTQRLERLEAGAANASATQEQSLRFARLQLAAMALQNGEALGPLADQLDALKPFAQAGAPTMAQLRAGFPALAQTIRAASRPEQGFTSIWQRATARLSQAVTVRRGDQVLVGDPAAGILARAEAALEHDDLAAALKAMESLQGGAGEAASAWVATVRDLLAARAALRAAGAAHETPPAPAQAAGGMAK